MGRAGDLAHRGARSGMWALALVIALSLAGCGGATSQKAAGSASGQTTAQATTTAAPIPTLDWRKITLPDAHAAIAFSPINGRDAWACAPQASGGAFQIWRTQDAAMTWQPVSIITPATPQAANGCFLQADQGDPDAIAASFTRAAPSSGANGSTDNVAYFSDDGGVNWARLPGALMVGQVATIGTTTYATLIDTAHADQQDFVVSTNHLASWRSILPATTTPQIQSIFWAAPSGELLWTPLNVGKLYHSANGGASWTVVPTPAGPGIQVTQALWNAQTNAWLACGYQMSATAQTHGQNECSADLGKTWTARADLTDTWECEHCGQNGVPSSGVSPCFPSMLMGDGALLAVCGNDPQDTGQPASDVLSRLPTGATTWTTLGSAPCQTASAAQTGQLWCVYSVSGTDSIYVLDQLP